MPVRTKPLLIRITTAPISLRYLLAGQMRFMSENGMEVIMVSSDGKELEGLTEAERCQHYIIPMARAIHPIKDLIALWKLVWYFKKIKPDIVHSHTPKAGLLGMLAARIACVPHRIHTVAGLRYVTTHGIMRSLLKGMEWITNLAAQHVWPNSIRMHQFMLHEKIVSAKKSKVIRKGSSNGVDLNRYAKSKLMPATLKKIKEAIQYQEGCKYFLVSGRLTKDKGIPEVIESFIQLANLHANVKLILVGQYEPLLDPLPENTISLIHNHPSIKLIPWTSELEYYMAIADFLVHASHREGFPSTLLQAGAMECPILCSNIDGNIDLIEHEKTGFLFEKGDAKQLLQLMQRVFDDHTSVKICCENCYQLITHDYDQRVIHAELLDNYRNILNQNFQFN